MEVLTDRQVLFDIQRARLFGIAYRMLGSKTDAEDMLQETYLRWHQANVEEIRSSKAWLISVLTRLCIDRLRVAKTERAVYPGPWLPEPLIGNSFPSPEDQAELASNLSMAFLLLLERLAPEERAAFLLYDVFDCDYPEIARMLGKTQVSCRQIVHRARARVRSVGQRFDVSETDRSRLAEKFAAAMQARDEATLFSLFATNATLTADGGGKAKAALNVIRGSDRITRLFLGVARKRQSRTVTVACINGQPGVIIMRDGLIQTAISFETDGERIFTLYSVRNPEKLKAVLLPEKTAP